MATIYSKCAITLEKLDSLKMPQNSPDTNIKAETPRAVFPYLNGLKDSISKGERIELKTKYLNQFSETLVGLETIANSLKTISELQNKKRELKPDSPDLKKIDFTIEDNLITIRQSLDNLNHNIPESGFDKIGKKAHISVLGQDDFIGILHEKFGEEETKNLLRVATKIKTIGLVSVSSDDMALASRDFISKSHNAHEGLKDTEAQVLNLRREGKDLAAETLIEDKIRENIPSTESKEFQLMARAAGLLPGREVLSEIRYQFTTPSTLVDPHYNTVFSIYGKVSPSSIPAEEERSIAKLKTSLWDHKIEWTTPTNAEADVRFIETAYATNKRLGNLFSSLRSSLSEIDKLKPELRETSRKSTLTQFWKLYEETSVLINLEFKNTVVKIVPELNKPCSPELDSLVATILKESDIQKNKGSSLVKKTLKYMIETGEIKISDGLKQAIRENMDLNSYSISSKSNSGTTKLLSDLAQPYEDLSNAIASKAPQSVDSFYSGDALSSTSKTFSKTLELTNEAFNIVGNGLSNIQASPDNVLEVLNRFRAQNESHPEKAKIISYISKFKRRFGELGVK